MGTRNILRLLEISLIVILTALASSSQNHKLLGCIGLCS